MSRNLLLTGGPAHDFDATGERLVDLLADQGIESTVVDCPATALDLLHDAEAGPPFSLFTVHALHWGMDEPRYTHLRAEHGFRLTTTEADAISRFVRDGGGLLALHSAVICFDAAPTWRDLCGASWDWTTSSHPPVGAVTVAVTDAGRDHPITSGLDGFVIDDEVYGFLDERDDLVPLLTSAHGGRTHPVLWARAVGRGRVVTDLLGHGPASFAHPVHQTILSRAAAWARRDHAEAAGSTRAHGR